MFFLTIFTYVIDQTSPVKAVKAPKGYMFEILAVNLMVTTAGNNNVVMVDRRVEDDDGTGTIDINDSDEFFAVNCTTANLYRIDYPEPVKCKWYSIARASGTSFIAVVTVHYRLVQATRTDLLWEWFRKNI